MPSTVGAEVARPSRGLTAASSDGLRAAARPRRLPCPGDRRRDLRLWGHLSEARGQHTAAVEVLRADPGTDTVRAPGQLAAVEALAGSPSADDLSAETLILGQALGVGTGQIDRLLLTRRIYLSSAERRTEAIAYFRQAARLAEDVGNNIGLGRVLLNLADALSASNPAAAAEAAGTAAAHLRRAGAKDYLARAIGNLVPALLMLGDWETAEGELTQAADSDGLDNENLACHRGWLAALQGDTGTAETILAGLPDLRTSEDPQEKAVISLVEALTAVARHQPENALRHARAASAHADALGISYDSLRWAWPLAARAAYDLGDALGASELLSLLDSYQPGHLAPMMRAECDLVRARLAVSDGGAAVGASFKAAVNSLRELSTPYHLAHGLLDDAQYRSRVGDANAAAAAIREACDIGQRLRCQPILDRSAELTPVHRPVRS